jgi:hypothetical protein
MNDAVAIDSRPARLSEFGGFSACSECCVVLFGEDAYSSEEKNKER